MINNINEFIKIIEPEDIDLFNFMGLMSVLLTGFVNYEMTVFEALIKNNDIHNFIRWGEILTRVNVESTYLNKVNLIFIFRSY